MRIPQEGQVQAEVDRDGPTILIALNAYYVYYITTHATKVLAAAFESKATKLRGKIIAKKREKLRFCGRWQCAT